MATLSMFLKCTGKSSLRNVLSRTVHIGAYSSNGCSSKISQIRLCAPFVCRSGTLMVRRTVVGVASPTTGERPRATRRPDRPAPEKQVTADNTVDGQLRLLDDQARRWGRVDREQVQQLLDLVRNAGSLTVQQGVMLVRCTGSLLTKEAPADRIKLCEQVCETLQKSGTEFNVHLYNVILRVKLENGQTFSPVEVLNEMEMQKQLVPNRATYQLMLSQFCELGDIEGASKILEHMKKQNLSLNEAVFNSLVKGHVRKGDLSGATAVMNSMREAGLDPTADTYTVLMCGMAEKGDVEGIRKVIGEARGDDIIITPRNIYTVILSLAEKGHQQHIDSMLEYIETQTNARYNQDALNCMFQLVAGGFDDAAYQVYMCMDRSSYVGQEATLGRVLLRNMVIKGRPVDVVIETWNKLRAEKLCPDTLEEVANWAFRYQHSQYALEVLEKMKSLGFSIKQHYFWPLLSDAAKRADVDGVFGTLRQMIDCSAEDNVVVGTVFRWAIKDLIDAGQKLDSLLPKMKEIGMSEQDIQIIQIASHVYQGSLGEASRLINAGGTFSPGILKAELADGFVKSGFNASELGMILKVASEKWNNVSLKDVNSGVLLGILKRTNVSADIAKQLVDVWVENNLQMFKNFQTPVNMALTSLKLPQDSLQKMEALFVEDVKMTEHLTMEELRAASVEQLEAWLDKAKQSRYGQVKTLERWLLFKYCSAGMVDKADALKSSLDSTGFVYSPDMLRQLGLLAAKHKSNLEEASNYLQQLESQYPSYAPYAGLVVAVAQLQMAAGKFADAVAALKKYSEEHGEQLKKYGFSEGYHLSELGGKLVESCCEHNSLPQALELVDILFNCGYVKSGTYSILDELVDGYIKKSDADSVILALEHCVSRFSKAPNYSEVFRYFIANEDAERLQKAVDLVTTLQGEMDVLLRLSGCFVECGKVKQARRILETPGLRALNRPLIDSCERFIFLGKDKELEQLVDITKNLFSVDRGEMLLQLMRLHARRKDMKKMLEVFSLFEEEAILPKPRVLRYVAKVLQSEGQPVPFDVPAPVESHSRQTTASEPEEDAKKEEKEKKESTTQKATPSSSNQELLQYIESADIAKLLEMRSKAPNGVTFSAEVIRESLRRHELQTARRFLNGLAEAGDVETMMAANKLNLPRTLKVFIHQCLFRAHIHRNSVEDILDYLKNNAADVPKYLSVGGLFLLAKKRPDLMNRLEAMALDCVEQTKSQAVSSYLYNYYLLTGQLAKVKQLLQKNDTLRDTVRQTYVCQQARRQQKEDILHQIIELHRSENKRRVIVPYNHLLLLKCEQGDWKSALQCYETAVADGVTFNEMWVRSLQALEALALASKQPVPWPAGSLEKKAAEETDLRKSKANESSSSSDSSDSDTEKSKSKK